MKKYARYKNVFKYYYIFVFNLNLATFWRIVRKRKQRRKSMIGPSGVSLGEHLFAHSKTENVPPKCCQKHTQEEQIVDFRLGFCFLRVRKNNMIFMHCCEKNTPVTKILFNINRFSFYPHFDDILAHC